LIRIYIHIHPMDIVHSISLYVHINLINVSNKTIDYPSIGTILSRLYFSTNMHNISESHILDYRISLENTC